MNYCKHWKFSVAVVAAGLMVLGFGVYDAAAAPQGAVQMVPALVDVQPSAAPYEHVDRAERIQYTGTVTITPVEELGFGLREPVKGPVFENFDGPYYVVSWGPYWVLGWEDYDSINDGTPFPIEWFGFIGDIAVGGNIDIDFFDKGGMNWVTGFTVALPASGPALYSFAGAPLLTGVPDEGEVVIWASVASPAAGRWWASPSPPTVGTEDMTYGWFSQNGEGDISQRMGFDKFCDNATVSVHLMHDTYGSEVRWELADKTKGGIVGSGGPYPYEAPTLYTADVVVNECNCYEFSIIDSYGDGLWAPGYYEVYWNGALQVSNYNWLDWPPITPPKIESAQTGKPAVISIELMHDTYGSEVRWELTNNVTGAVVASGGPYPYEAPTLYTADVTVNSCDCWDFTIIDSYGDGLWPPGYYNVYYNGILAGGNDAWLDWPPITPPKTETVPRMGKCPVPPGACCDGLTCTEGPEFECTTGTFMGEWTVCGAPSPPNICDCQPNGIADSDDFLPTPSKPYVSAPALPIPDCTSKGNDSVSDVINVAETGTIVSLQVDLQITHSWVGDLYVTLTSPAGTEAVLLNRPGMSVDAPFCDDGACCGTFTANVDVLLRDPAVDEDGDVEDLDEAEDGPFPLVGEYAAFDSLSSFALEGKQGAWTIKVYDGWITDTGTLDGWSLHFVNDPLDPWPIPPAGPHSQDCNANTIPDECDIASGFSLDVNADNVPDECQDACPNDTCATATVITGIPFHAEGELCASCNDDYQPFGNFPHIPGSDCFGGGASNTQSSTPDAVFVYTPAADIVVDISTLGSKYDTVVAVYEGTNPSVCDWTTEIACDADFYGSPDYAGAIKVFQMTAGKTYYIVVDGQDGPANQTGESQCDLAAGKKFIAAEYVLDIVSCPPGGTCLNDCANCTVKNNQSTALAGVYVCTYASPYDDVTTQQFYGSCYKPDELGVDTSTNITITHVQMRTTSSINDPAQEGVTDTPKPMYANVWVTDKCPPDPFGIEDGTVTLIHQTEWTMTRAQHAGTMITVTLSDKLGAGAVVPDGYNFIVELGPQSGDPDDGNRIYFLVDAAGGGCGHSTWRMPNGCGSDIGDDEFIDLTDQYDMYMIQHLTIECGGTPGMCNGEPAMQECPPDGGVHCDVDTCRWICGDGVVQGPGVGGQEECDPPGGLCSAECTILSVGACCRPDGTCALGMTPPDCELGGGHYEGDATTACTGCAAVGCLALAPLLSCNSATTLDTSTGSALDPFPSPSCLGGPGTPNLWRSFVATDSSVVISTLNSPLGVDSVLALYDACGDPMTELGCSEDHPASADFLSRIVATGLTVGDTYYILVGSWTTPEEYLLEITCPYRADYGACCLGAPTHGCADALTEASCTAAGGTFLGAGILCDVDTDGDGVVDRCDNCPGDDNPGQENCNGNATGDACEVECPNFVTEAACGEECDDGNATSGDGCDANCIIEFCGDGITNNVTEQCDDGDGTNPQDSATCDIDCTFSVCGDNYHNAAAGEQCDDGGVKTALCNADCTLSACGDGNLNIPDGEECDDGNTTSGDGCDAICVIEFCGDNITNNVTEECDDGAVKSAGCDADCTFAVCGDGNLNTVAGEECDDGNTTPGDGCDANCIIEFCGDNITNNVDEDCDDGAVDTATCDFDCTFAVCGDGYHNEATAEECDGADPYGTDFCDANCEELGACCWTVSGYCEDFWLEDPCLADRAIKTWHGHTYAAGTGVTKTIIPTISEWGLLVISLLLVAGIAIKFGRREVKA